MKPTYYFCFTLSSSKTQTSPINFGESPLPKSFLLFKNFLLYPTSPWKVAHPDTVLSNSVMFQRNFLQQKASTLQAHQLFANLDPNALQPFIQHYSWHSCISHTFLPCFTGCVTALLWQNRNSPLGHPEHQSFNIQMFHTKNIGAAKKNPFGLRIFNHLRE